MYLISIQTQIIITKILSVYFSTDLNSDAIINYCLIHSTFLLHFSSTDFKSDLINSKQYYFVVIFAISEINIRINQIYTTVFCYVADSNIPFLFLFTAIALHYYFCF